MSIRDRFDILLEKRLSGAGELRYKRLYGKCEIDILIPNNAPKDSMIERVDEFQKDDSKIDVNLLTYNEIEEFVSKEYEKIEKSLKPKKKKKAKAKTKKAAKKKAKKKA